MSNYSIPLFFSKIALHGGGHLQLKKMHKVNFWGIFGIRLGRCPCIIPEKISFLQFYSRFNPNALALILLFLFLKVGNSIEPAVRPQQSASLTLSISHFDIEFLAFKRYIHILCPTVSQLSIVGLYFVGIIRLEFAQFCHLM